MKRLFLTFLILMMCLTASTASAITYATDIMVTSPNGIWTDARAYPSINSAITAVGANERTIVITNPRTVTTLTVPANVTLDFRRNGSITNSGQLTINTEKIIAPNRQIFTGVGNIDFADGTIVKTSWFSNIETAFALTTNDTITLVVTAPQNITASYSPGTNVTLKWESPGNILTVLAGRTVGNLKNIEAGNYQLFAGAGDFDFLDGTRLKLSWFARLRSAFTWIESAKVSLIMDKSETLTQNEDWSTYTNVTFKVDPGTILTVPNVTVSFGGPVVLGEYQAFSLVGTGLVLFTGGSNEEAIATWFGTGSAAIQSAIDTLAPRVYIPEGTWAVAGTGASATEGIRLRSNLEMYGAGQEKTIISQGVAYYAISAEWSGAWAEGSRYTNIHLHDFKVLGSVVANAFLEHRNNIQISGVLDFRMERVSSNASRSDGIIFESSYGGVERHNTNITIRDCIFDGVNNDNRQGISIIDGDNVLIESNLFINHGRAGMPGAIDIENNAGYFSVFRDIRILNNKFKGIFTDSTIAIQVSEIDVLTTDPTNFLISGNTVDSTSNTDFRVEFYQTVPALLTTASPYHNVIISNNIFAAGSTNQVYGTHGLHIVDNNFHGLQLILGENDNANNHGNVIEANISDNLFNSISGGYPGLRIGNASYLRINNNRFIAASAPGAFGIEFYGNGVTTVSSNVTIRDNIIAPNVSAAEGIRTTSHTITPASTTISGNVGPTGEPVPYNWGTGIQLLSVTTIALDANADTTIYTVPSNGRLALSHAVLIAGADAGATTTISIGANGSETDFIPANTLSNLDAEFDAVTLMPVPNTTPTKTKTYAGLTVIQAQVANQSGGVTNRLYLFGFLY